MPALAQQVAPLRCRPSLDGVGRGLGDGIAAAAVSRAARYEKEDDCALLIIVNSSLTLICLGMYPRLAAR